MHLQYYYNLAKFENKQFCLLVSKIFLVFRVIYLVFSMREKMTSAEKRDNISKKYVVCLF